MSNGNDKAANLQRITEVAQIFRGIFGGDEPEEVNFTDEHAMAIAEILTRSGDFQRDEDGNLVRDKGGNRMLAPGVFFESGSYARQYIALIDQEKIDNAVNVYIGNLLDEKGADFSEEFQALKGKADTEEDFQRIAFEYLYGRKPTKDADATFYLKDFTEKNADTLVNEVTNKWASDIGVTDRAFIAETLRPVVEGSLYKHWNLTGESPVQGAPTFLEDVPEEWALPLQNIYRNMDKELEQDPSHLLLADKVILVLDSMELAEIITPLQRSYMMFPNKLLSTQEREELGADPRGDLTEAAISNLTEMMGNVVRFADDTFDNAFNRMATVKGVETLAEAFDFFVQEDLKKPLSDSSQPTPEGGWRDLPPLGFDEVTLRKAEYQERLLAAYGQEGKKFNDQVTDLMRQFGIETDASLVVGKTEKAATKFANARFREDLDKVAEEARAEGRDTFEVFQAVNDAAIAYMEGGQYQEVFSQHSEFITQHDLSTISGSEKFIKENYREAKDLTSEQLGNISEAIRGTGSRSEADAIIREGLGDALRASYQLSDAKEDFNKWYLDETGRDPSSLDKDVLAQWQRVAYQAGGIEGLLAQQEQTLISADVATRGTALYERLQFPSALITEARTFSSDEITEELLNNIARGNAMALDEPPEGIEAFNKFLRDEFFAATKYDLSNFPDVKRRLRFEMSGMGRAEASQWLRDNVQRISDEVAAAAIIPASLNEAISQIEQMYVDEDYDIGEIPASIINSAASELFRKREGLTEELRQQFISDLDTQLPELAEKKAFAKTETVEGLRELAFDIAVDEGIISPSASPEFIQHFKLNTIPRVAEAASMGDFENIGEFKDFFLNEFRLGTAAEVSFVAPTIHPADLTLMELVGEIPPAGVAVSTPAKEAVSGLKPFDVSEADYERQTDITQIPAFPTEFEWEGRTYPIGSASDRPSPEDVAAATKRTRLAKEEELARLDFAYAQEQLGGDMAGMTFEEYMDPDTARNQSLADLSSMLDEERLTQEQGFPASPGMTGDPERIRALEEQIASLQTYSPRGPMAQARQQRLREEMDKEYREEQARLRSMPQLASATQFATAIREAAPDDIGFQQFLLGQDKEIRGGFKGTAGTPQDFSEYFVGITPGLRQRYGQTPQGVASELMRFEREEREAESESEQERIRSLRGRGRTELRI